MALKKLKIVIWCGAGANQKALANKIAASFDVAGIVIDDHSRKVKRPNNLPAIFWDKLRFRSIYNAWKNLMDHYNQQFPAWPNKPLLKVLNINSEATRSFTEKLAPDLIVVSGTSLIGKPLINMEASIGIINLHTGLSPYVKGGPNCTNWCIANNSFHLVGNTIMWLNEGIDSGNIITTETTNIQDAADLDEAHLTVMEHAHHLYIKAISYLAGSESPYISVPQASIGKGHLYLTKMWTTDKRKKLLTNWKKRRSFTAPYTPQTVSLK